MRTPFRSISIASLLLVAAAASARGEDAAPANPADAAAKVLASLPAPSDKAGLKVDLELWTKGMNIGSGSFVAAPGTEDGKPVWNIEEKLRVAIGAGKELSDNATAVLGQDLRLIRSEATETGVEEKTTTVKRTDKGFEWTKKSASGEKSATIEAEASTTSTLCSIVLFLMHCPSEPAVYEVSVLDREKGVLDKATLETKGAGKLVEGGASIDSWVANGSMGEFPFEVYLTTGDPGKREFQAIRMVKQEIVVAKAGLLKAFDFSKPTASATECGTRLAMGILTSDEALIASVIHWPSMLVEETKTGFKGDEAAVKEKVMADLRSNFKTLKPLEAWPVVKTATNGAKETAKDDLTSVTFGAPMSGFVYTAKSIDGVWMITKFGP